jgi:acyl transferase domain-containing protein
VHDIGNVRRSVRHIPTLVTAFAGAGPALSIDTACSSAIVAVHVGRLHLMANGSAGYVSSGVNLMLSPTTTSAIQVCQAPSQLPSHS